MVNCKISPDRKLCALELWNLGWEISDICLALAISRSSLYRWRNIFDEHGNVLRPPSPLIGRTRIITHAALTVIKTVYDEAPSVYLDELCTFLAVEHDIMVSIPTLSRNLLQAGLTRKRLRKIAIERDEALRDEWKESLRTDFSGEGVEFVCLDETSKNEHTWSRGYGRSVSGQAAELKDVFVRGDRYSLVAAITTEGYIATRVVPGSFDALEFYDFVTEDVLPQMHPFPDERSVLVLDNCRIHHNDPLVNLVRSAGCLILYLPAYSPDLNPIEESFSTLKKYLRCHGAVLRHHEDPIFALTEACGCITPEMCKGWFRHAGYIL